MRLSQRNYTIDLLRVIASFGVITVHVKATTTSAEAIGVFFSPFCVVFFFIVSLTFFVAGLQKGSAEDSLLKSFSRIYIPYLTWTVIYTSLLFAKASLAHSPRAFVPWRILFYGESSVQLYYLPDLFALLLIAAGLYSVVTGTGSNKFKALLPLVIGILFFWIGNFNHCFGMQGEGILLKLGCYILFGFLFSLLIANAERKPVLTVSGIVIIIFTLIVTFSNVNLQLMNYPLLIPFGGLGLLLFAIGFPLQKLPGWLKTLSENSYGIYLCHVLFLEGFEFITDRYFPGRIEYTFVTKLLVVTGIFILSSIFTEQIRKFALAKRLLLGEETPNRKQTAKEKEPAVVANSVL